MKFAILFVLYKSYGALDRLFQNQNWNEIARLGVDIFVVDNTPIELKSLDYHSLWMEKFGVLTLDPNRNLGYFGAPRWAQNLIPDFAAYDFFAISNVDLTYSIVSVANALQKRLETQNENVGMYAPCLVDGNGSPTRQLHYFKKPDRKKYEQLANIYSRYNIALLHRFMADIKRKFASSAPQGNLIGRIFAPHGALMIFTKSYLSLGTGFDHPVFLFCEEIFAGMKCERANLYCELAPEIAYQHENHGSMGKVASRQIVGYLRDAHIAAAKWL